MRPLTSAQLAVLDSTNYQVSIRAYVADGDDVLRDYMNQFGYCWVEGIRIAADVDQPVQQLTLTLRRDIIDGLGIVKSLSMLRGDSAMNRNSVNAFAPAIDNGRRVQISVEATAVGVDAVDADYQNMFEGVIDSCSLEVNPMVILARDKGGKFQDRYVERETIYGSDLGEPLEFVSQAILNDWGDAEPLYAPSPSDWDIETYTQTRTPVMDALQTLATLRGWDVRFRWDPGTAANLLTLASIDRAKTIPDRTINKSRYINVTKLTIARTLVRNVIWVYYTDAATGVRTYVEAKDDASIAEFGRQWMDDDEAYAGPINSAAVAQTFADAMLADLSTPKADQTIEEHFDWSVELNDLHLYQANGEHYDADQKWAVVSYEHNITPTQARTTVSVRGKPCGRYYGWLGRRNIPVSTPSGSGPSLVVNANISADSVDIDVQHTGALTLSIDGGLTFGDPAVVAGITAYPTTVTRPDSSAGLSSSQYVFKASLNGQVVTHPVVIPATDPAPAPAAPPDSAYGSGASAPMVIAVHAEYQGRVILNALAAARIDFDTEGHFTADVSDMASARIIANVATVGAAGSRLALEYFNTGSALWDFAGISDITVPIDALGVQQGSGILLTGLTGRQIFRLVTLGGNGVASPMLGNVYVEFTPINTVAVGVANTLYLRDLAPSSAPLAAQFPMSSAEPFHVYGTGTNITATASSVRALRGTMGADASTPGTHLEYGVYDTIQPRDLFPGAFCTEPFNQDQSVAAGVWEMGVVANRTTGTNNTDLIPKLAIYLLRLYAGVWSKVATIYDAHDNAPTGRSFSLTTPRVSKKTVNGASFDAVAGDVLVVEIWAHYDQVAGHKTGRASTGVDDGAGVLFYDGPNAIPLATADGGAWGGGTPASYIKPPISLDVG